MPMESCTFRSKLGQQNCFGREYDASSVRTDRHQDSHSAPFAKASSPEIARNLPVMDMGSGIEQIVAGDLQQIGKAGVNGHLEDNEADSSSDCRPLVQPVSTLPHQKTEPLARKLGKSSRDVGDISTALLQFHLSPLHFKINAVEARLQASVVDVQHRLKTLETSLPVFGEHLVSVEERLTSVQMEASTLRSYVDTRVANAPSFGSRRQTRALFECVVGAVNGAKEAVAAEADSVPPGGALPTCSAQAVPEDLLRRLTVLEERLRQDAHEDRVAQCEHQVGKLATDVAARDKEQRCSQQGAANRLLELERRLADHERGLRDFPELLEEQLMRFDKESGLNAKDIADAPDSRDATIGVANVFAVAKCITAPSGQLNRGVRTTVQKESKTFVSRSP